MERNISVAGVARKDGRILVMHRLPGGSVGCLWEFPGGKVDPGESPSEALQREWMEETGYTIEVGEEIARGAFMHKGRTVDLIAFHVHLPDGAGDPALVEHDDFKWATVGEIGALPLVDSDNVVLDALKLMLT